MLAAGTSVAGNPAAEPFAAEGRQAADSSAEAVSAADISAAGGPAEVAFAAEDFDEDVPEPGRLHKQSGHSDCLSYRG